MPTPIVAIIPKPIKALHFSNDFPSRVFSFEEAKDPHIPPKSTHLEWYSKVLYYFCLIPFRPVRSGTDVNLCSWKPQQLVCITTTTAGIISLINQAIHSEFLRNIYVDPIQLFFLVTRLSEMIIYNIWVFLFWRRQTVFRKILVFHEKIPFCVMSKPACKTKHYLKTAFVCILPVLLSAFIFYRFGPTIMSLRPFKPDNKNQTDIPLIPSQDQQENWKLVLKGFQFLVAVSTILLSSFVDGLTFCIAFTCMEVTTRYREFMERLVKGNNAEFEGLKNKRWEQLTHVCVELKTYFGLVNEFGSEYFLCWFCMIVPWMSYRITESFPGMKGSNLENLLYNYVFIIVYAVSLLCAAETRRQAEILVDLVHEAAFQNDGSSSSARAFMYNIKHIVRDVGLKGGHFFQYSYGFLGSTVGFVIAYAFFVFQFRVESNSR